jgi:hypothetical protein|tara:strand:- start:526 stop:789 length:264 start_codon:yes stop_codon:yes gene_type:complete
MTKVKAEWYLALTFDCDKHNGFDIAEKLEEKFEENVSGTGYGGGGRDINFYGSKKDVEKIQSYVNRYYKKALTYEDFYLMDADYNRV